MRASHATASAWCGSTAPTATSACLTRSRYAARSTETTWPCSDPPHRWHMLSIDDIAVEVPAARAVVATDFERLHLSPLEARVYSRLYGFNEVSVAAPEDEFA